MTSPANPEIVGPAPSPLGRPFVRVWTGQILSLVGSYLSGFGAGVFVLLETGSEAWLGLLAATAALPFILVGPFLGIVDRVPRRTMMLVADSVAALGPIGALLILTFGDLQIWHLLLGGFVAGLGSAFQQPASMAAVPLLVERDALERANGLVQLGPAAGIVLGPLLAGPLVAWGGIRAIMAVDLFTFAVAFTLTATTSFGRSHPAAEPGGLDLGASVPPTGPGVGSGPVDTAGAADGDQYRSWASVGEWLRGPGRPMLTLLAILAAINFILASFSIAAVALSTNLGGAGRAGLALALAGMAIVAGGIRVARHGLGPRRIRSLSTALLAFGVGSAVAASRPSFAVVVAGLVIAMLGVPAAQAAVSTTFHERVPAAMQGRVFGIRGAFSQTLQPLGSLVTGAATAFVLGPAMDSGPLADTVGTLIGRGEDRGPAATMLVIAAATIAGGLWLRSGRVLTDLDQSPPDEPGS